MKEQKSELHELTKEKPHLGHHSPRGGGSKNPDYKKPRSPEYWAIRVGLVILGLAIGFIVCGLNN